MIKSKKRTIGFLSIIVLLCACLFVVSIVGNTRDKAYAASASSVDLTQAANYSIGTADELAFTSVDGSTQTDAVPLYFADAYKAAPTVVEGGLSFAIKYGFTVSHPVKFATPISIDGGVDKMTFTVYADLSPAESYGLSLNVGGGAALWGTKGVFIYPLDSTGAAGEGVWVPYTITQRQEVELEVTGSTLAGFLNEDGAVEGFVVASCIGAQYNQIGDSSILDPNSATLTVKSVAVSEKVYPTTDTVDLTKAENYALDGGNALTAIAGKTEITSFGGSTFNKDYKVPASTESGLKFSINQGFTNTVAVLFNEHILVEEGDSLFVTLNCDLSTLDWSFGHANGGYPANPWGAEIMIYPIDATGAAGEGYQIPYLISQRKVVTLTISGDKLAQFVDNGKVKGFVIASAIANFVSNGFQDGLKSGASITVSSISTVNPVDVYTAEDLADGNKVTLFTANNDYVTVADPVKMANGWTPANMIAGHGPKTNTMVFDNINTLDMANDGAYYSFADMKAGSEDGYALAMEISGWGLSSYQEIKFAKAVKVEDINTLSFRIFASLNDNSVSGVYAGANPETGYFANTGVGGGIFFYGSDATRERDVDGILLNPTVQQREWTDVIIEGDDLAKLADANGYISGFSLGSYIIADTDQLLYQDGATGWNSNYINKNKYDRVASIFIDSITAYKAEKPTEGVKFMSISTEGDIGVNFYAYLEDAKTATFTFKGETSEAVDGVYDEETGCYKFTYAVAPVDYKEEIQINIGEDIEATYSVYQYSQDINEESDAYALVVALMDYCEAANVYFNNDVAEETEALDVDLSAYASSISGSDDRLNVIGASLILEDKTSIYVYFEAEDINGIEFAVDGEAVEPVAVAGKYVIKIENIVAKDLDKTFTITVGGYTITYSALSYVNTVNNGDYGVALANVVKAIYAVSVQAEAYFA